MFSGLSSVVVIRRVNINKKPNIKKRHKHTKRKNKYFYTINYVTAEIIVKLLHMLLHIIKHQTLVGRVYNAADIPPVTKMFDFPQNRWSKH